MGKTFEKTITFFEMGDGFPVQTDSTLDLTFKGLAVESLEMEDVLFHHNSAVLMPANPQGESSDDGTEDDATDPEDVTIRERQEQITGIRALAAVFKQFEIDNRLRIILAGHTDTSGEPKYNFELSDLRASGVLYLIRNQAGAPGLDDRSLWSNLCWEKHKVEDYQQILKYFHDSNPAWNCDPGKIDDDWGPNTKQASDNFFQANGLGSGEIKRVARDSKKRWTVPAWEVVYDLYQKEMASALHLKNTADLQSYRNKIKWLDPNCKLVSCGESFPVDDAERSSYRSQENRRVEILFFNSVDLPDETIVTCPPPRNTVHEEHECPFWNPRHLLRTPLAPEDLNCTAYHLKFVYFDRIKKNLQPVPGGLAITVHETTTGASQPVSNVRSSFKGGVYILRVPDNPARKGIHFEFKTTEQLWVYTAGSGNSPEIKPAPADMASLPPGDRIKYYDLPREWSSVNYWVRKDETKPEGDRYLATMNARKVKPYGGDLTAADSPLVFSLDDVVLVESNLSQNVNDTANSAPQDLDQNGNKQVLSEHSRVALLHFDSQDDFKVKIYREKANEQYFSNLAFKENLICNTPPTSRAVVFCSDFYDVTDKRTTRFTGFDFAKNHLLGARAAVKNDPDASHFKNIGGSHGSDVTKAYVASSATGNIDMHYLHGGAFDGKRLISAFVGYWSCRFWVDATKGGTAGDKTNYISKGMKNAMERINAKDYTLVKSSGDDDILIKTYFLYEAKQDISPGPVMRGGKHKCRISLVSDTHGSNMGLTSARFRHSAYQDEAKPFGGTNNDPLNNVADFDGSKTKRLTVAHELGHASGWHDEYIYYLDKRSPLTRYKQYYPGMPYIVDRLSIMKSNHATRMRQFWGKVNWLNDNAKSGKKLHKFLGGTDLQMSFPGLKFNLVNAKYRNIYKPAHESLSHHFGTCGKNDLLLYKLGEGKTAHAITSGGIYSGILVVRTYISAQFFNHGTSAWSAGQKYQWLIALERDLSKMLNKNTQYRLECTDPNNDFVHTFLRFVPHYEINTGSPSGKTQVKLKVTKDGSATFNPSGSTLNLGDNCSNKKIIRYLYGKASGTGNLTAGDFSDIVDWIKQPTVANGAFSVKNV